MIKKIIEYYYKHIASCESYARHIGVTIGKNCYIDTKNWSSEPYLVKIGDNVGLTHCVSIHTHGGGAKCKITTSGF